MPEQDWQATVLAELGVPSSGLMTPGTAAPPVIVVRAAQEPQVPEPAPSMAVARPDEAAASEGPAVAIPSAGAVAASSGDVVPGDPYRPPRLEVDPAVVSAWRSAPATADAPADDSLAPVEPLISGPVQPALPARPEEPSEPRTDVPPYAPADQPAGGPWPSGDEAAGEQGTAPAVGGPPPGEPWTRRPEGEPVNPSSDAQVPPPADRTALDSWDEPPTERPARAPWDGGAPSEPAQGDRPPAREEPVQGTWPPAQEAPAQGPWSPAREGMAQGSWSPAQEGPVQGPWLPAPDDPAPEAWPPAERDPAQGTGPQPQSEPVPDAWPRPPHDPAQGTRPQPQGDPVPDAWPRPPHDPTVRASSDTPFPAEPAQESFDPPQRPPGGPSAPEPSPQAWAEGPGSWGVPPQGPGDHARDARPPEHPPHEPPAHEQVAQASWAAPARMPAEQAAEPWGPPGQEPWSARPPARAEQEQGAWPVQVPQRQAPQEQAPQEQQAPAAWGRPPQDDAPDDDAAQVPWEAARSPWGPAGPPGDPGRAGQGEQADASAGGPAQGGAPYAPPRDVPPVPGQWAPSGAMAARDLVRRSAHGDPLVRRMSRSVRRAVGVSAADEVRKAADVEVVLNRPVPSCRQIAVTSIRGGAGKTTVAGLTATVISQYRQDRVLAVDADSGLGSLPLRMGVAPDRSLHDLVGARPQTFDEAARYLARTTDGLWVLSGTAGGRIAGELELPAFRTAAGTMSRYFATAVVDCGAGLLPELQRGILSDSHAQIMVTPGTVDGALSAQGALEWQARNGYEHLLSRTVIAFVTHTPHVDADLGRAARVLSADGLPVVHIPYDRHLAAGTAVESARIGHETRAAMIRIAVEAFARAASV